MCNMWAFGIVKPDPLADPEAYLSSAFQSVQINAFILWGPAEPFHEDAVQEASLAIHMNRPGYIGDL